jgi:hypothetical protein
MSEFIINTLTHPAFTAIIGFLAGHFFAIGRARRKEFNEAANVFREAFIPELSAIKSPSFDETVQPVAPYEILRTALKKHRTAYEIFRLSLQRCSQRKFDRVWHNYYTYDDTGEDAYEHLVKYSSSFTGNSKKECKELAIANIEKLLKFARHK